MQHLFNYLNLHIHNAIRANAYNKLNFNVFKIDLNFHREEKNWIFHDITIAAIQERVYYTPDVLLLPTHTRKGRYIGIYKLKIHTYLFFNM